MRLSPQSIQQFQKIYSSISLYFKCFYRADITCSRLNVHPTRVCLFNVYATFGLRSKAAPNMVNKQYAFISWKQSWTKKLEIGTDGGGTLVACAYIKESTDSYTRQ